MNLLLQQKFSIPCLVPNCREWGEIKKKRLLNYGISQGLIKEQYMENECEAAKA